YIESFIFNKKDFAILKRKDFISYITGNKNAECAPFMEKYMKKWISINLIDQGLHIGIILMFLKLTFHE
ncbi:MAG: hypothetical protein KJ668_20105, partial [Proteobacteria bacterium]|nr:hypothetical protein [Pseudomonadota bacterium]